MSSRGPLTALVLALPSLSRCYGARWLSRKTLRDILLPPGLRLGGSAGFLRGTSLVDLLPSLALQLQVSTPCPKDSSQVEYGLEVFHFLVSTDVCRLYLDVQPDDLEDHSPFRRRSSFPVELGLLRYVAFAKRFFDTPKRILYIPV
jgi:hypothetical protein